MIGVGNKLYKHGIVMGKFRVLHAGHIRVINEARKKCHSVTVIISEEDSSRAEISQRRQWIEAEFPDVWVMACYLTGDPAQDACTIRNACGMQLVDAVFTGSDYNIKNSVASHLEAALCSVHRDGDLSSTLILEDPIRYWNYLAPSCRVEFANDEMSGLSGM